MPCDRRAPRGHLRAGEGDGAEEVPDFGGGTRIGVVLDHLPPGWGRRRSATPATAREGAVAESVFQFSMCSGRAWERTGRATWGECVLAAAGLQLYRLSTHARRTAGEQTIMT